MQGDDSDLITDISHTSTIVPIASAGAIRKIDSAMQTTGGRFLAPLEKQSASSSFLHFAQFESSRHKRFEVTNHTTNSPLPSPAPQISLCIKNENKLEPITGNLDNLLSTETIKGFTLSGKGAMFLKANISKKANNNIDTSLKLLSSDVDGFSMSGAKNSQSYKSILRDPNLIDVRNRLDSKAADHEMEDKKIVRFNFDAKEESSGNATDHDAWDFAENFSENNFVKEVNVTNNNNTTQSKTELSYSHKSPSAEPTISGDSLTSIFDRKTEQDGRIKPLYEDTDSESMVSIKSTNRKSGELSPMAQEEEIDISKQSKGFNQHLNSNNYELEIKKGLEDKLVVEEMKLRKIMGAELDNLKAELIANNKRDLDEMERNFTNRKRSDFESNNKILTANAIIEDEFNENLTKKEKIFQQRMQDLIHRLDEEVNDKKIILETQHNVAVEQFKHQLNIEFEEKRKTLLKEHTMAADRTQQNHKFVLEELERDLKTEEELIKKDHAFALVEMREKLSRELELERQRMRETGENRLYEKIRCEKRLLEDKYRCLKDKYVRLKNDVKISLERRNQRRELQSITGVGPDTGKSVLNKVSIISLETAPLNNEDIGKPPTLLTHTKIRDPLRDKTHECEKIKNFGAAAKYLSHIKQQYQDDTTSISQTDTTITNNYYHRWNLLMPNKTTAQSTLLADNGNSDSEAVTLGLENNNNRDAHSRQRKKSFTRLKSASTSRLSSGDTRSSDAPLRSCTPVENLRLQLQKLEDLEDQFPENSLDTTYHLRYPFNIDSSNGQPAELEYFKVTTFNLKKYFKEFCCN